MTEYKHKKWKKIVMLLMICVIIFSSCQRSRSDLTFTKDENEPDYPEKIESSDGKTYVICTDSGWEHRGRLVSIGHCNWEKNPTVYATEEDKNNYMVTWKHEGTERYHYYIDESLKIPEITKEDISYFEYGGKEFHDEEAKEILISGIQESTEVTLPASWKGEIYVYSSLLPGYCFPYRVWYNEEKNEYYSQNITSSQRAYFYRISNELCELLGFE